MSDKVYYNGPCVYVITAKETPDIFKIGCTSYLLSRFKDLRSELKLDLAIVCYIPTNNAWLLEQALHKRFADKHVGREWFELDATDIAAIRKEYNAQ